DVLHLAVRELRRLFDDGTEQPGVIETIRKRGYRLVAPIEPVARTTADAPPRSEDVTPGSPTPHSSRTMTSHPRTAAVAAVLVVTMAAGIAIARYGMGRPASVDTEAR